MTPRVDSVLPDSPAAEAGFKPGDVIKSIDGAKISSFSDLQRIVSLSGDALLSVVGRVRQNKTLLASPFPLFCNEV